MTHVHPTVFCKVFKVLGHTSLSGHVGRHIDHGIGMRSQLVIVFISEAGRKNAHSGTIGHQEGSAYILSTFCTFPVPVVVCNKQQQQQQQQQHDAHKAVYWKTHNNTKSQNDTGQDCQRQQMKTKQMNSTGTILPPRHCHARCRSPQPCGNGVGPSAKLIIFIALHRTPAAQSR